MKRLLVVLFVGVGVVLGAAEVEAAIACQDGVVHPVPGAIDKYVVTGFVPRCSSYSEVHYLDDGTNFAVQAASSRGRTIYGASTADSGVKVCSIAAGVPNVLRPTSGTNPC